MKKISKSAGVLLIATVLLLTSVAVMADTVEEQKLDPRFISGMGSDVYEGNMIQSAEDPLYTQEPYQPFESWIFMTSHAPVGYRVHDNFPNIAEEICDLHWWGLSLVYDGGWQNCDPEGMCFQIIFWDGLLGNPVCTYNEVCPPAVPTGTFYSTFEMFYWETVLDPCCDMSMYQEGWLSIQSYSSQNNCWFLWAGSDDGDHYHYQEGSSDPEDFINDTAFELTPAGPPPVPAIACSGVGTAFGDVDPGQNVTCQIKVCNDGEPVSFLNWEVDTTNVPTWGTWKFIPEFGTDVLHPNCEVIDVECTITSEEGDYSGTITVINSDDPSDTCSVTVSANVIVPRARTVHSPLFMNLLQQFPALYLIIKIILGG
jgi:hypothetical protein